MLKWIKRLIEDFREFRLTRRMCSYAELSEHHKAMVYSYNKDYEKQLDSLVLRNLYVELLNDNVSAEYVKWFRSALTTRINYLSNSIKFQ